VVKGVGKWLFLTQNRPSRLATKITAMGAEQTLPTNDTTPAFSKLD
jgi:hypothetical protein